MHVSKWSHRDTRRRISRERVWLGETDVLYSFLHCFPFGISIFSCSIFLNLTTQKKIFVFNLLMQCQDGVLNQVPIIITTQTTNPTRSPVDTPRNKTPSPNLMDRDDACHHKQWTSLSKRLVLRASSLSFSSAKFTTP